MDTKLKFRKKNMRIFDIHAHIYPDKIARKASASIGTFYGGMAVHGDGSLADCIRRMDEAGVERFAAHSVAISPHNVESINHFIYSAWERYPQRIVPFAAIHPDMEDMQATVDGIVARGFRGIKVHPDIQGFALDGERAAGMMEAIAGRLPLLIHAGDPRYDYDGPRRILHLHELFPKLQLICAHFGGWNEWEEAMELLPGHGLMIDTSSSLYRFPMERAEEAVRRFGAENVLYGTDYPMWTPQQELTRFMRLRLSEREREDILWNNAARLFQL